MELKEKIIIELDRGHYVEQKNDNANRTLFLEFKHFCMLCFKNSKITCELEPFLEKIYKVLEEIKENPLPQYAPLKRGPKVNRVRGDLS